MTPTPNEPGERRPRLDRPPGERYEQPAREEPAGAGPSDAVAIPFAVVLGTVVAFTILGGILAVTAGLVVVAAFAGWLTGRLVSPPLTAALVGLVAVALGFVGIWLFGRVEGGVLGPVDYLLEVEGPVVVVLSLLAGSALAAASSR